MRDLKDITMLIVDDEPELRKALAFDFKRRKFNVLEAENGTEGFEIVKRQKVHLILTDVRMPGGDGVTLLNNVKTLDPELPIVMFITGFADISLENAYEQGADAIFSKPFERKALIEGVMRAITLKEELWSMTNENENSTVGAFSVELQFEDLNAAMSDKSLNLGRGGMFVALDGDLPIANGKVKFKIEFKHGDLRKIEGEGIVRWVRMEGVNGMKSGFGVEFERLTDETRTDVLFFINTRKTRAFIPMT